MKPTSTREAIITISTTMSTRVAASVDMAADITSEGLASSDLGSAFAAAKGVGVVMATGTG